MSNKAAGKKQAGKGRNKKESLFPSGGQQEKKEGREPEMPACVSIIGVSQIARRKTAITSRAEWLKTVKRAEREQSERNKDASNASFYFRANSQLHELFSRARSGDLDAAKMLLSCLNYNVGELEKFCSSNTRIAKQMVVIGESWPLLHSSLKPNNDGALTIPPDHFLRKLGVVRGKRRYNTEATGTAIAATLYKQMEHYRHTLPQSLRDKREIALDSAIDYVRQLEPFSPSNWSVWWNAAKPLLVLNWGEEFQDHPRFKKWNAAAYKDLPRHEARSAKRHDIKKAINQGFMSLANSLRERVLD